MAPGRLVLGIGIGGEDRHEVEITGVDPATRGRRTDESLGALRNLLTGTPVTHHGEFFDFDEAIIRPAPSPSVPIVIGGRSDAAFERVARFGDGWLGAWVSPERFAASVERIEQSAALGGRDGVTWRHGMSVWCGFGRTREEGAGHVAPMIERLYKIDFERFERYTPTGSPEDVAEALVPYVRAGVADLNLISVAADPDAAIQATGEVRRLLAAAG
jgi:alkanesulfonate monooxygenase SsuD/methylene tetrahydromethanopterin reductase-like flavin-dependent oxidoreductase (luciferase family)